MIAYLRGRVLALDAPVSNSPGTAVFDVNGVGYRVSVPAGLYAALKEREGREAEIHVSTRVQDGEATLYGFDALYTKRVFECLLRVSGVGPSLGLAILSTHRAADVASSIAANETVLLERVPRIGKKLASRILLDLKDSMGALALEGGASSVAAPLTWRDVVSALVNMGYRPADAEAAARTARERAGKDAPFETAFRAALDVAQRKP